MTNPKRTVAYCMIGTGVVVAADKIVLQDTAPAPRDFVAPFAVYAVLSFLVSPAPKLAAGLAGLVLVSVVVVKGPGLWGGIHFGAEAPAVDSASSPGSKKKTKPPPGTPPTGHNRHMTGGGTGI